jgi:hypothetical protein
MDVRPRWHPSGKWIVNSHGEEFTGRLSGTTALVRHCLRQARQDHDAGILPMFLKLRAQGLSLTEIGCELMARGYPPRRGSYWHKKQLLRILQRSQAANQNSAHEIPPANADPAATIPAEGAIDSATIPLDGMAEPVTMPVSQTTEPVMIPAMEMASSVHGSGVATVQRTDG